MLKSFNGTFFKKYKMFILKKAWRVYRDLFTSLLKYKKDVSYQKKNMEFFLPNKMRSTMSKFFFIIKKYLDVNLWNEMSRAQKIINIQF